MATRRLGSFNVKKGTEKEYLINLNDGVEIFYKGKKIQGPFLSIDKPVDKLKYYNKLAETKLGNGVISEEEYNKTIEKNSNDIERHNNGDLKFVKFFVSGTLED